MTAAVVTPRLPHGISIISCIGILTDVFIKDTDGFVKSSKGLFWPELTMMTFSPLPESSHTQLQL